MVLAFILGMGAGTFLDSLVQNLPRKDRPLFASPRCRGCGCAGSPWRWLPGLGILGDRRCPRCGGPLDDDGYPRPGRRLAVEVLAGLITAGAVAASGPGWPAVRASVFAFVLIVAALTDLSHRIIPNPLMAAALVLWPVLALPSPAAPWWSCLAAMVVGGGFFLLIALVSKGGMGGGDVKLAAVIGLYLGLKVGVLALFLGVLAGACVSGFLLLGGVKRRGDYIPFGPFLAVGGILSLYWGDQFIAWYLGMLPGG